jgi:hypothetical protein
VYGVVPADLDLSEPAAAFKAVVAQWCGFAPPTAGREFTLIAPKLVEAGEDPGRLERRGAFFHLLDAELRHEAAGEAVRRAVLRWQPVRRTAATADFRMAAALARALRRAHPEVPLPRFDLLDAGKQQWWYWHGEDRFRLAAEQDGGQPVLVTAASWVTEGFADLRQPRLTLLRDVLRELAPVAARPFGKNGEICAPLVGDFAAAAELAARYYDLLDRLGCFSPYRWHRRPASAR